MSRSALILALLLLAPPAMAQEAPQASQAQVDACLRGYDSRIAALTAQIMDLQAQARERRRRAGLLEARGVKLRPQQRHVTMPPPPPPTREQAELASLNAEISALATRMNPLRAERAALEQDRKDCGD